MQMGLVPYPYPFVVGAPDMYTRAVSTPMTLPMFLPSPHPHYRPTPSASPNTELKNISSELSDDRLLEDERRPRQSAVQIPRESPVHNSVYTSSVPARPAGMYIKEERSASPSPPAAVSLPSPSTEGTKDFINSLNEGAGGGSSWRPFSDKDSIQVKEEEKSPAIGPVRRTRASTRSKRSSAIAAADELDEESKVNDRGYFPRYVS